MTDLIMVIIGSLLIFLAERTVMIITTRRPAGRDWIRRHRLFHPNSISYMRMPMGLVAIGMWHAGRPVPAFLWFAFWMITDLTDGTIARSCDLITESGKGIDPLSDKLLYCPVLLYLALAHRLLPVGWVVALVILDTVGQLSRFFVTKTAANSFGKSKTGLITLIIILAGLHLLHPLPLVDQALLHRLTICATVLAFLSFYCKVAPDAWYANTFTTVNVIAGAMATISILWGNRLHAFLWILLPPFLDLFDTKLMARRMDHPTGRGLADLADGFRLGIANALLIFVALGAGIIAFFVAALYSVCTTAALLRVQRSRHAVAAGNGIGLPPAVGALLSGGGALLLGPVNGAGVAYLPVSAVILLSSFAMVVPLPSLAKAGEIWPRLPTTIRVTVCLAIIVLLSLAAN